jgi:hypothetical protein
MTTFTIDEQHNITAFATKEEAVGTNGSVFTSQKELGKLAAEWPVGRFVDIWNGFAGVGPFGDLKPVKKFTDRKTAVARIWQAIQKLDEEILRTSIRETEAQLKKPQLPGPVRECQAESLHIGMAGPEQLFDFRNLPAAALRSLLPPFHCDFIERAPVTLKGRLLAGEILPALDDDIHVLGVQFHAAADALGKFCRR